MTSDMNPDEIAKFMETDADICSVHEETAMEGSILSQTLAARMNDGSSGLMGAHTCSHFLPLKFLRSNRSSLESRKNKPSLCVINSTRFVVANKYRRTNSLL